MNDLKFAEARFPQLRIYDWGNAGKKFNVKVLTREGMELQPFTSSSDRSMSTRTFRLSNLPMLVSVEAGEADVRRGEIYVLVQVRFAGYQDIALLCGYVSHERNLTWPPGVFEGSVEGPGLLRSITGTDPAAGAEISVTVPINARWRLISARALLVAGVAVANRLTYWIIDDGTTDLMWMNDNTTQTAGQTIYHRLSSVQIRGSVGLDAHAPLPVQPVMLFQGWRLRTNTDNLQAADNYGAPQLFVEEWIEE